jgi:hypothetical protein
MEPRRGARPSRALAKLGSCARGGGPEGWAPRVEPADLASGSPPGL